MKIYGYQLSQATMRIRIALNLKQVPFEEEFLDLLAGDQFTAQFSAVNPQHVVPAVVPANGEPTLFQSMAILEYLEETHPEPPLLPADPPGRARVRGLAQIIVANTHRSAVPSVRRYITETLGHGDAQLADWIAHWVGAGLAAFESHLRADGATGRFCHGDTPTFADLCLFPQILGAKRFNVSLEPYPIARRIFDRCLDLTAFTQAVPAAPVLRC